MGVDEEGGDGDCGDGGADTGEFEVWELEDA